MNCQDYQAARVIRKQIEEIEETLESLENLGVSKRAEHKIDNYNQIIITGVGSVFLNDDDFAFIFKAARERMTEKIKSLEVEFSII